jgi:hypothetical protein
MLYVFVRIVYISKYSVSIYFVLWLLICLWMAKYRCYDTVHLQNKHLDFVLFCNMIFVLFFPLYHYQISGPMCMFKLDFAEILDNNPKPYFFSFTHVSANSRGHTVRYKTGFSYQSGSLWSQIPVKIWKRFLYFFISIVAIANLYLDPTIWRDPDQDLDVGDRNDFPDPGIMKWQSVSIFCVQINVIIIAEIDVMYLLGLWRTLKYMLQQKIPAKPYFFRLGIRMPRKVWSGCGQQ